MKPFDLEKAKAGAPLCTREGFRARIVCFDADNDRFPIVALLKSDNGKEYPASFTKEGRFSDWEVDSSNGLLMVGEKKEGWMNIYKRMDQVMNSSIYETKGEAMYKIIRENEYPTYITTVRVEWEE